jgi:single-strand DNA-binding protein
MNRVLLTGRLTRDPEMRTTATGKTVTQFSVATNEYRGGQEKPEYHAIVTWDRLAEICARYLGKGPVREAGTGLRWCSCALRGS